MGENVLNMVAETQKAIQTFYHCPIEAQRQVAHQWLLQLQQSDQGWLVAWLLTSPGHAVELQYYGASILHFKVSRHLNEVTGLSRLELKNKFLHLLAAFTDGPRLTTSKLCSAYAAFIINSANEDTNLTVTFKELESICLEKGQWVVLELLSALPVEVKTLNLDAVRRASAKEILMQFFPVLVALSENILRDPESNNKENLLKCLLAWVEFGTSLSDLSDIVPTIFKYATDLELSESACDVLVELITAPTSYTYSVNILNFAKQLLELDGIVHSWLDKGFDDRLNSMCLVYTNLCETHCRLFVTSTDAEYHTVMMKLVNTMLSFAAVKGYHPVDETCSERTFMFWYTLQDDLLSLDVELCTSYHNDLRNAYMVLIQIFSVKAQYPPEKVYDKFTADEKEQFRCYRIDIQDTVAHIYNVVQERSLEYFAGCIQRILTDVASHSWQELEAVLHLLQGTTQSIDFEESVFLPRIISMLHVLPSHPVLLETTIFLLGSLSGWLDCHEDQVAVVLPFLLHGVMREDTSWASSIALKDICQSCPDAIRKSGDMVVSVVKTCCSGLTEGKLKPKVLIRLAEIGASAAAASEPEEVLPRLELITLPLFERLQRCLLDSRCASDYVTLDHVLNCFLGVISSLGLSCDHGDATHPVLPVYSKLLPLFSCLRSWIAIEEIAVATMLCVGKAVEVAREKLAPAIPITTDLILQYFGATKFSCFLNTSALIVGMFSAVPGCEQKIRDLVFAMCDAGVEMITSGNERVDSDWIQGFMNLILRALKADRSDLLQDHKRLSDVLQCSLALLRCQEGPTISCTCNWLVTFVNLANSNELVRHMVMFSGSEIVLVALACIGGTAPRRAVDNFTDLLLALSRNFVSELATWMGGAFGRKGFPTAAVSEQQKEHFKRMVLMERSSKRRLKEAVQTFSLLCRGLYGTAYAGS